MLTIYPESELYQEIKQGNWKEAGEIEKFKELKVLITNLKIPVFFAAMGASNAIPLQGSLPQHRQKLLSMLDEIIQTVSEEKLRQYRTHLPHL